MAAPAMESVQCFGRKKTAVAVTYGSRPTSPSSSLDDTVSLASTCASASRAEVTTPRSTPSVRASLIQGATTVPCSSLIQGAASPRSSVVVGSNLA
uniref:Uncharacterized protein n=1 Tax=Fagus sylvatica TaxID=28930 RepID=A0A2N9EPZ8_FAGSY